MHFYCKYYKYECTLFSEDKKTVLSGGKLSGDLNADNWAILNVPAPMKSHQAIPKAFLDSVIPIGIICLWSGDEIPHKWALCNGTNGTPLLPIKSISTKKQNYIPTLGGNTVSAKYVMYTG